MRKEKASNIFTGQLPKQGMVQRNYHHHHHILLRFFYGKFMINGEQQIEFFPPALSRPLAAYSGQQEGTNIHYILRKIVPLFCRQDIYLC